MTIKSRLLYSALLFLPSFLAQADDRGFLAKALLSEETAKETGIDVRGWLAQGANINSDSPDSGFNGPVSFNDRSNNYQLNQLYGILERKIETSSDSFSVGGRVDVLYGTDAAFTQSIGFDEDLVSNGTSRYYKLAIPQAYLDINAPVADGLRLKIGHFYTLIGYEVVTAPDNIFYSHALTMQYGQPFTHWGALASYQVTESLALSGGVVRGWDNLTDSADGNLAALVGATYTFSPETSLALGLISGNEGQSSNRTEYSAVLTHKLSENMSYVLEHDLGIQENGSSSGNGAWYSLINYLVVTLCDDLSMAVRGEIFRDEDGIRVAGLRSGSAAAPGNFVNATFGFQYRPTNYLMIRPEVRWDLQTKSAGDYEGAFNGRGNQLLFAVDAVFKF